VEYALVQGDDLMTKPGVLFLGTGDAPLNRMAEAFVRKHAGERIEAHSASLEPTEIHPGDVEARVCRWLEEVEA
jgi:protein-tyrosine-phosphatase